MARNCTLVLIDSFIKSCLLGCRYKEIKKNLWHY